MKAVVERFLVVPFSGGCSSRSSIDVVATNQPKRPAKSESKLQVTRKKGGDQASSNSSKQKMRSGNGLLALPKHNISSCMHKLIRSVRSLSQVFVYKDEEEEVEREMEIGYPTDVKHVTHIGLDGSTTTNHIKGWETLKVPEIISFPSISLRQFELAMASQANHGTLDSNSKLASA